MTNEEIKKGIHDLESLCLKFKAALEELAKAHPEGVNPLVGEYEDDIWGYVEDYDPFEVMSVYGDKYYVIGLGKHDTYDGVKLLAINNEYGSVVELLLNQSILPTDFPYILKSIKDLCSI